MKLAETFAFTIMVVACTVIYSVPVIAQQVSVTDASAAIDQIFQAWNKPTVPGCAVGIDFNDEHPLFRSYGSSDLEHGIAINPATVFEAGSVSKQFTAASIILLVEQGKLAFSDDVRKYLPELPNYGSVITINQLLGHTSGLRDWGEVEAIAGWPRTSRVYSLNDTLDITTRQQSLNFQPGTAWSYTNTGYNLLAIIVERVSKQTLAQFGHDHLFAPLGMNHTMWRDNFRRVVADRAIAYTRDKDVYQQLMPFENTYGHGGLLTTVGDLLLWNQALTEEKLGKFVTKEITQETTLNDGKSTFYARGLFISTYHNSPEISHDGSTAGYRAWLGRFPDEHVSIAMLCNAGDVRTGTLAHAVADVFLPAYSSPKPANIFFPVDELKKHIGKYVDLQRGQQINLDVQNDALVTSSGAKLTAVSSSEFMIGTTKFNFIGQSRLVIETNNNRHEYTQMPPWQQNPEKLKGLIGSYSSSEAMATYIASVDDGKLVITPSTRLGEKLVLHPVAADVFLTSIDNSTAMVRFKRDLSGRVTSMVVSSSRVYALTFKRAS
jgi:CubicO group peptidase (beta-lactamase class C family)